ncbi:hypothetical protein [Allobaculum stercoricanis]|uniref:hypothetical protein n=1 Tax=Allobaculum stercoricanis TaxID=174709 RepID=UPI002942CBD7|nr:hypothetical protein [Allobaculum stercoricanis]
MKNKNEVKCFALDMITENVRSKEDAEYIAESFKSNKGFVGINTDNEYGRVFALFDNLEDRKDFYNRLENHFRRPMAAFILEPCYVDKKYLKH